MMGALPFVFGSVVVAELGDEYRFFRDFVDNAVFVVDATGPVAGQCVAQGFGFADALEGLALDFLDEGIDSQEHLAVGLLPVKIILPGVLREDALHLASVRSVLLPPSSSATDSSNRLALLGLRSR